ncbi:MAG: AbrB/MazE/SpoVT family DNA-binding domain-containing protein [Leptospirillia bacterium]
MARSIEVRIGPQGRLVIPSVLRKKLKIEEGTRLMVKIENDSLVLELPDAVLERTRQRFSKIPKTVSLVDELIADRRSSARQE